MRKPGVEILEGLEIQPMQIDLESVYHDDAIGGFFKGIGYVVHVYVYLGDPSGCVRGCHGRDGGDHRQERHEDDENGEVPV